MTGEIDREFPEKRDGARRVFGKTFRAIPGPDDAEGLEQLTDVWDH